MGSPSFIPRKQDPWKNRNSFLLNSNNMFEIIYANCLRNIYRVQIVPYHQVMYVLLAFLPHPHVGTLITVPGVLKYVHVCAV